MISVGMATVEATQTLRLSLWGMTSDEDRQQVREALLRTPGVLQVELAAGRNTAEVTYDPRLTGPQRLVDAVWCSSPVPGRWHGASIGG